MESERIGAQLIGISVTQCRYLDEFPYQNFSVKARCNHLVHFLKSVVLAHVRTY